MRKLKNHNLLNVSYTKNLVEAGCDEVGVGCLAGPIVAAAVILPKNYRNNSIFDSKQLNSNNRILLEKEIKSKALSWAIGTCSNKEIDNINPKKASFLAMHRAIEKLKIIPELLLIDGHIFIPYLFIPYRCIIKGDTKYTSIAAASILAKVHRDRLMTNLHQKYPKYGWKSNVGYPTKKHIASIKNNGITEYHRKTFGICKIMN